MQAWERRYNYPNVGFSLSYQDLKNEHLGENFGAYAHLGFYFLNRHLLLKVGQGLAVTTNPYHPDDNYRNNAYGSRLLSSTIFTGNFQFENLIGGLGFQTGLSLIHYSNADFKSLTVAPIPWHGVPDLITILIMALKEIIFLRIQKCHFQNPLL